MPFLTQGKTNWRYILIVLILAVIVGGLTLYWTKIFPRIKSTPIIKPPKPDKETVIEKETFIEVNLSSDSRAIEVKNYKQLFYVYTIKQWQEWAKKNWSGLGLKPINMGELGVIGDEPEDFIHFISVSLSPDKSKIAFSVGTKEIALSTFSMNGILNLETEEVNMIPNIIRGDVRILFWSPTGKHFAYTVDTSKSEGDILGVDDVLNRKNSFMLNGEKIGSIVGETDTVHFIPQFRNLEWSSDGEKLYFKTNDKEGKGEIEWVINREGTGLKRIIEETAEWKTYRNEEYGFEIKYPPYYFITQSGKGVKIAHVKWKDSYVHHPYLLIVVSDTEDSIDKRAQEHIREMRAEALTVCPEEGFTMHCVSEFAEEIKIGNNIRALRYKRWFVSGGEEIILVQKEPHPGWIIEIVHHIAGSREPGEESITVLDKMLSTLRFLE